MHLDPGVNRLGLYITSVHQTDCRPVTPDIVFPICVILRPQEDGLETKKKKHSKTKKRSIHFTNTLTPTHTHPGSEKPVLVPCRKESLERSQRDYKQPTKPCKWKEGESCFYSQAAFKAGRNTSGKKSGQTQETALE